VPDSTASPLVPSETCSLLVSRRESPSLERRLCPLSSSVNVRRSVEEKVTSSTSKVSKNPSKRHALISSFVIIDSAGVIVSVKGDMKGQNITGPVAKECSELWPKIAAKAGSIA